MNLASVVRIGTPYDENLITWDSDVTIGGTAYRGGKVVRVGDIELSGGSASETERTRIAISLADPAMLTKFATDRGAAGIEIGWAESADEGATWTLIPRVFRGRVSHVVIVEGIASIEIETFRGDVEHTAERHWSHETQLRKHPGDLGMEYMRDLASQAGVQIGWPR